MQGCYAPAQQQNKFQDMKKIVTVIAAITLLSCTKKEDAPQPQQEQPDTCDCWIKTRFVGGSGYAHWLYQNFCTNEEKTAEEIGLINVQVPEGGVWCSE